MIGRDWGLDGNRIFKCKTVPVKTAGAYTELISIGP